MITDIIVFIIALVALFFPFMKLTSTQIKGYLKIAALLMIVPFLITLLSSWIRSAEADLLGLILLQGGITSILLALGYGITAGLLLHGLKVRLLLRFAKARQSEDKAG